mmetsp:Transcript_100115/g.238654  ORF Transcript_100115/g.238654 Transcript_100115/m.238654 type:complete len:284 (-) Transcript_100115:447-1298(-)
MCYSVSQIQKHRPHDHHAIHAISVGPHSSPGFYVSRTLCKRVEGLAVAATGGKRSSVALDCQSVSCLDRLHIHITLAATGIKDPGAVNAIAKVLVLPWAALFLDCHDLQPHLAPVAVVVHPARCCQLDDLLNWGVLVYVDPHCFTLCECSQQKLHWEEAAVLQVEPLLKHGILEGQHGPMDVLQMQLILGRWEVHTCTAHGSQIWWHVAQVCRPEEIVRPELLQANCVDLIQHALQDLPSTARILKQEAQVGDMSTRRDYVQVAHRNRERVVKDQMLVVACTH